MRDAPADPAQQDAAEADERVDGGARRGAGRAPGSPRKRLQLLPHERDHHLPAGGAGAPAAAAPPLCASAAWDAPSPTQCSVKAARITHTSSRQTDQGCVRCAGTLFSLPNRPRPPPSQGSPSERVSHGAASLGRRQPNYRISVHAPPHHTASFAYLRRRRPSRAGQRHGHGRARPAAQPALYVHNAQPGHRQPVDVHQHVPRQDPPA